MSDKDLTIKMSVDTSDLEKGLDKAEKKVEKTADGAEKTKSKWSSLGDSLSSVSPTFKKMSDKWSESSQKIDDRFGKSTAASKLFKLGVVGALAAIALKAGQTVAKFASETAKMFDPKGYSKAAGAMQKSIKKLKTTIGSFTAPLVNGVMTVVSKIVDGITWVLEKLRVAKSFLEGVVKGVLQPIIDGVKQVVDWIKSGINALANLLGFGDVFKAPAESAEDAADSMGEVVDATSAGLASFDKLSTLDTSGSGDTEQADKLNESMEEANKLGEEIGTKIREFFDNFSLSGLWDGFLDVGGQAWEGIKSVGEGVWNALRGFGEAIWNGILAVATTVWNAIKAIATAVWNAILAVATVIWQGIQAIATTVWNIIQEVATTVWNAVSGVATAIWEGIQAIATTVWNVISGIAMTVWNTISSVATVVWQGIQSVATTVWEVISTPILALWEAFKSAAEPVWKALEDIGSAFIRVVIDPIKNAVGWCMEKVEWVLDKIDAAKSFFDGIGDSIGGFVGGIGSAIGLAGGGAVAPNNPMPYILGDNTREYEVVSPVSLMKDTVKSALAEMGGTGGGQQASTGPIELTISLDSRKIARAVYDPLKTEERRRGAGA